MNNKGFSLPEVMIAMGIMAVVSFGGYKAYEHFGAATKKEVEKMNDLQEFNQLTRDLLKFTEGAGVSTVFLNLPVKVKNCEENQPCVRKLKGETFVDPNASELPTELDQEECIQFYADLKAKPASKKAYPDRTELTDLLWGHQKIEVKTNAMVELMATWPLKDENSPPILMMKMKEGGIVLNMIRSTRIQISRSKNESLGVQYAFFHSSENPATIKTLLGYPFLIYGSLYPNHYTIQYAADIIHCGEKRDECVTWIKKIFDDPDFVYDDTKISEELNNTPFPSQVYAIQMKPIDFSGPFFKGINEKHKLPSTCTFRWGDNSQDSDGYFFPSQVFSVSQKDNPMSDLAGTAPLNVLHLNHYYTSDNRISYEVEGKLLAAVPIDLFTYKIEPGKRLKSQDLVSELWHATEVKKRIKIHDLNGPFTVTRKIGSAEMGIWYNPLSDKKGAQ